jgi:hypothetical protein
MIHLREHNNYRKTHDYLTLDTDAKTKFEFHCTKHEALQLEQVQKQAALMAAAQGAQPGQPGQPGPGQPGGPQQGRGRPEPSRLRSAALTGSSVVLHSDSHGN